jgi:predicted nucleic acid-binding protein
MGAPRVSTLTILRQYRLSHGFLIPDALIAATAIAVDEPLISKDQSDYRFIENLRLLAYPMQIT